MKEIIIIPHIGIGQLKLGMAPDELEKTLLQMKRQWSNSSNEAMQMERCAETDDPNLITGRYMDNDSFFLVQYRNGKATEIGIQRDLSKVASIKLFGMDMFNTTAECIIDSLMKKDKVICNEKDLQLGTEYIFPKSGVRLWRERAFHPKLLKDPLYMTLFSSNRLRPSASMETIRGPNSLTWQCHRVSGIPRSRHWASTISSTSVAATTALPAGKTQWMAPNSLQARSVLGPMPPLPTMTRTPDFCTNS